MNASKKILKIIILLILVITCIYLFIDYFSKPKINNSTSSSSTNTITKIDKEPVVKDNKTIEVIPISKSFESVANVFDQSKITDKEYVGINGSITHTVVSEKQNPKVNLYVVNSTFAMSTQSKEQFILFKSILNKTETITKIQYNKMLTIFKNIDEVGGYQKEFISEIELDKNNIPKGIDIFRAMFTADGIQFPSPPTITILGKSGNDYFVVEYRLDEIDHDLLLQNSQKACLIEDSTINECIKLEYDKNLKLKANPEFLNLKTIEALKMFKFYS